MSGILIYHFAGLLIAPATVPPCARVFQQIYPPFGWWLQGLNMNQGNHFFAPDPGASTLVGYVIQGRDGREISGRIPSKQTWPRLLYHRHFMLSESLGGQDEGDDRMNRLLARAFARELLRRHNGESVVLTRVTHFPLRMEEFRGGLSLDVPTSYEEESLGRYEWTDFWESAVD